MPYYFQEIREHASNTLESHVLAYINIAPFLWKIGKQLNPDPCADPEGGAGGQDPPLKNHRNIGFLSITGLDLRKTKPSLNSGPSSARQRNAI